MRQIPKTNTLSKPKCCREKNLKGVTPLFNDSGVGSLNQTLKRIPSKRKDIFQVKLRDTSGPGKPYSDPKSQNGSGKPIKRYLLAYQNFELYDNLKRVL